MGRRRVAGAVQYNSGCPPPLALRPSRTMSEDEKKSKIALGIAVICLIFGLETIMADRRAPNPLSPLVWSVLALVGAVALVAGVWFHRKAKRQRN